MIALSLAIPFNVMNAASYSVFYLNGDPAPPNEDGDAVNFASGMNSLGYTRNTYNSTLGSNTRPTVSNILNAKNSTFMYISGHGMPDTEMFVGPLTSPTDSFAASFDFNKSWNYWNTTRDDPYNYVGSSEIGKDYIDGTGTMTNSRWDGDMKWLFLGACSQLDYKSSDTSDSYPSKPDAVYNGLYAASIWGRTMLGYISVYDSYYGIYRNVPKRLHGVAGYYGSAPAGTGDNTAIDSFFQYTNASIIRNIRTAWQDANYNSNWGVLVHRSNAGDFMPGKQSGLTADTTGTPVLDLYRKDSSNYNVPMISSYAATVNTSDTNTDIFESQGITFKIATNMPSVQESVYSNLNAELVIPDITKLGNKLIGLKLQNIDNKDGKAILSDKKLVALLQDGKLEYRNLEVPDTKKQPDDFKEEQAIQKANEFLEDQNLLPEDTYVDNVYKTVRVNDILNETQNPSTDVLEYHVSLKHKFDGKTLNGDEIWVSVNTDGVSAMKYKWHNVSVKQKSGTINKLITPKEALNKFKDEIHKQWKVSPQSDITEIDQQYMFDEKQGIFKPAWKIVANYDAPVLIDASKGE